MQTDLLISPPRTIMEVYRMLPEGTLAEVIDSKLYVSPAPKTTHQRIVGKLFTSIFNHLATTNSGEVFLSPYDVYLDEESNVVQPDIIYVEKNQNQIVQEDGIHGVPVLLIEVLSPGNPKHDREIKKALYEQFKVKEYWIIDPHSREAKGFLLKGNKYISLAELSGRVRLELLHQEFEF